MLLGRRSYLSEPDIDDGSGTRCYTFVGMSHNDAKRRYEY